MLLSFIIPTCNRPKELELAVKSIAAQVKRADVQIIVIGKIEENGNKEVCERMQAEIPFLQLINHQHDDYSQNFRAMFRAAAESEWAWTFGDDDLLAPGALEFMLKRIEEHPSVSFYHVAEELRSAGNKSAATGTLFDLCCEIGWLEMTGFISGNIIRGDLLAKAAETPCWEEYSRCAFVQSCALLETLRDEQSTFLDLPLIKSQSKDMTQESLQSWINQNIPARYLFISGAVEKMILDGIIPGALPPKFFRYLSYHLWDRFISHFIGDYAERDQQWIDDAWGNIARFGLFLNDEAMAASIKRDVEAARGMITLHCYMKRNLEGIANEIQAIGERHGTALYPYTFVQPNSVSEEIKSAPEATDLTP